MADNKNIIICPACQKEMVKVFVSSAGFNVDVCLNGCGGIYFDNKEYDNCDEQHENVDEIMKALEGKTFTSVDESLVRKCPVCGANMVKHFASPKAKVTIDDCYTCGGKFLDRGELQKIRSEYASEEERAVDVEKLIRETIPQQVLFCEEEYSFIEKILIKIIGLG